MYHGSSSLSESGVLSLAFFLLGLLLLSLRSRLFVSGTYLRGSRGALSYTLKEFSSSALQYLYFSMNAKYTNIQKYMMVMQWFIVMVLTIVLVTMVFELYAGKG